MKFTTFLYNGKKFLLNTTHGMEAFNHAYKIQQENYAWNRAQRALKRA